MLAANALFRGTRSARITTKKQPKGRFLTFDSSNFVAFEECLWSQRIVLLERLMNPGAGGQ